MNDKTKIILALMQIENISNLMQGNQWQGFMSSHLIPMKCELERQLSCINARKETV